MTLARDSLRRKATAALALALATPALASCTTPHSTPGAAHSTSTGIIRIAAAQSLIDVLPKLLAAYQQDHPHAAFEPVYGGSGTLATQMNAGSPTDIFIAADTTAAATLTLKIDPATIVATNRLVLVVPANNPARITGLRDVAAAQVALCAASVPCGRSAAGVLKKSQIQLKQPSEETDVRAVLAKVSTGQADAGFVYATDAAAAGATVTTIELTDAPRNQYPAYAVTGSANHAASQEFLAWLTSPAAQKILTAAGFSAP